MRVGGAGSCCSASSCPAAAPPRARESRAACHAARRAARRVRTVPAPAEAEPSARPLRVQKAIALIRALEDVATWNENVRTIVGNGKHRLQIGDILDRGSKKHPELDVIVRVAKPTDDGTLYDPAILWEGKDTIDNTTEYASKLAKWRKQYTNWHKDSARPLQLDEDAILEAIYTATPWYAPASSPPLPRMPPPAAEPRSRTLSWTTMGIKGPRGPPPHLTTEATGTSCARGTAVALRLSPLLATSSTAC